MSLLSTARKMLGAGRQRGTSTSSTGRSPHKPGRTPPGTPGGGIVGRAVKMVRKR
ncbi:MAG: hypothetical protein H0U77_14780 [Nocardioidaceae bacterium]|nr:hypothetical protein [Nocardioidaceae bacterium]